MFGKARKAKVKELQTRLETGESKHVYQFKEKHINQAETIVAWADGNIGEIMGKGDKAIQNGSLIVTESRVIFYRKGFFGEVLETMPLKGITSIERKSTLGFYSVTLHTSHDELNFKTQGKDNEAKLINAIEAGRTKAEGYKQPTSMESNLDKIKKLGELKESGLISEEEFNAKKQKLLADI